ncbi:restriction endonuclease subunit S [Vibrio sp. S11_S32]|uniref:restriction endonuclease subunit S n=1 Tax=Vibrio sp. S11_S32 TaxID=2720225 RepID=UPI0016809319|nr:restriction endonuclease subunit S [Vibrio sp. S11_S32]MBD1577715.1 restriction endonuclease subunit S [Vibrio sp. S11_S32]
MSQLNYLEKLLDGEIVEWIALGDVTLIKTGQAVSKQAISTNPGQYPVINSGKEPLGFIDKWNTDNDPIGITTRGAGVGSITWQEGKYFRGNLNYSVTIKDSANLEVRYLYHLLNQMQSAIQSLCTFDGIPALNAGSLKGLEIPIPCPNNPEKSLAIQAEIVRILDAFTAMTAELTAELNMRKKQYNYYRDQLLSAENEGVEWKTLEHICTSISAGGDVPKNSSKGQTEPTDEYPYPIYANATGEKGLYGFTDDYKIDSEAVTISARGAKVGYHTVREAKFTPIIRLIVLIANKDIISTRYLNYVLDMTPIGGTEAGIPQLTVPMVKKLTVPIPFPNDPKKSLIEQARIVSILDKFDTLTTSIQEGLPREIELRQKQYEYYRDLLLNFPKPMEETA